MLEAEKCKPRNECGVTIFHNPLKVGLQYGTFLT